MITDTDGNARAREQLVSALKTKRTIAVTGSGLSVWAGYPTWRGLISELAEAVRSVRGGEIDVDLIIQNNQNALHCIQKLGAALVGSGFAAFIRDQFKPVPPRETSALHAVANLPFQHVLTLNIEESLETQHSALNIQCGSITSSNRAELVDFIRRMDEQAYPRQILHLHGKASTGAIILTEDDYRQVYHESRLFPMVLWLLAVSRTLIFIGFGFGDSDFLRIMSDARRDVDAWGKPCHFAIVGLRADEDDRQKRTHLRDQYSVEPIFYEIGTNLDGSENHDEFLRLLRKLSEIFMVVQPVPQLAGELELQSPDPVDLQTIEQLGDQFLQRIDPGSDNA